MNGNYDIRFADISDNELSVLTKLQRLISTRGSLEILFILNKLRGKGVKYCDLKKKIKISYGALYPTLKKLVNANIVKKDDYLLYYTLTPDGVDLCNFIFEEDLNTSIKYPHMWDILNKNGK
jgi:DNA-binding HxlR family transcriptional regulator